jgi:hypothetical protein
MRQYASLVRKRRSQLKHYDTQCVVFPGLLIEGFLVRVQMGEQMAQHRKVLGHNAFQGQNPRRSRFPENSLRVPI